MTFLKEIGDIGGITKNLNFYLARHKFVMLTSEIPKQFRL